MRFTFLAAALASALTVSTPVVAQETATTVAPQQIKRGNPLFSADGKRLGRVHDLWTNREGTPVAAELIYDSRIVRIPLSTISSAEKGFVTSLTRSEVGKLR